MRIRSRKYKNIARIIRLCCITGAFFAYSSTAYATIAVNHNSLPVLDRVLHGTVTVPDLENIENSTMNITQTGTNAVIKWQDFSIGTNATVNFKEANNGNFNVLNYVDSGVVSQIYGNLNATNGNVFLVNTAGVLISKSAEINVGSLYVSNRDMSAANLKAFYDAGADPVINGTVTSAELMNLGHVKANKVTFDGERVVLDLDYLKKTNENGTVSNLEAKDIIVKTTDVDNVVIGYTAYDESGKTYAGRNVDDGNIATVNVKQANDTYIAESNFGKSKGYMWVKDVEQLQAIETNKSGNYALKNSIDAIATKDWKENDNTTPKNFVAIGKDGTTVIDGKTVSNAFTGKFDGLDNNIFGLTVTKNSAGTDTNVGLFGVAENATIRNVDMIAGSVTGTQNVGSIVGKAIGGEISNITTSMEVKGSANNSSKIGGIVGATEVYTDSQNAKHGTVLSQLDNVGTVQGFTKVGGIAGEMVGGELNGGSFNMGYVKGVNTAVTTDIDTGNQSNDIGGLVGYAQDAILGKENEEAIANKMEVSGGYNIGGIVGRYEYNNTVSDGNIGDDRIVNAVNSGDITATGYVGEDYKYHTDFDNIKQKLTYSDVDNNGLVTISNVLVSNVGGIVGNILSQDSAVNIYDVANTGNVQTTLASGKDYYYGGNVGGVVGRADGINITKATNDENEIRGGHNVGGIVGYIESGSINDTANTGDIMGTGAYGGTLSSSQITNISERRQIIRSDYSNSNKEDNIIGNIGGIAGYMYGNYVQLSNSGNRGNVHTMHIDPDKTVSVASQAANLGGVVGKMDGTNNTESYINTAYNTGDVDGYLNIGGIIGQIYNGLVEHSHNLGNIKTTRPHAHAIATTTGPINMGGIVGDATEMGDARAYINDVYNKGKIGNEDYSYHGRHVGGIVGRLSGYISNAYNTGDIFMGNNVVGGIVGYWYAGDIDNVFNTGNITVSNRSTEKSQVGGLIGAVDIGPGDHNLRYAYNLGTVRSFESNSGDNTVGGLVGEVQNYASNSSSKLTIDNVYTLSHLYARGTNLGINPIYGKNSTNRNEGNAIVVTNAYHILPSVEGVYTGFTATSDNNGKVQGSTAIAFSDRNTASNYTGFHFVTVQNDSTEAKNPTGELTVGENDKWRIYGNTMPILNVFMPSTKEYFASADNKENTGIISVQYGNAYDPYLTIINSSDDLTLDWLSINGHTETNKNVGDHTSLVVYGAGLTLNNFNLNNKMYGGILYADGALNISNNETATALNDIKIGSCADIYGASVNIDANSKDLIIYGNIVATGNGKIYDSAGDVILEANNIELIGSVTAAKTGDTEPIVGIATGMHATNSDSFGTSAEITNAGSHVTHIGELHSKPVANATSNGDVEITATNNVDILLGVGKQGLLDVPGNLEITSTNGNVYIDSDIYLNNANGALSRFTINANTGEVVLDLSNLGEVKKVNGAGNYLDRFAGIFTDSNKLDLNTSNAIIALDMWNEAKSTDSSGNPVAGYDSDMYGNNLNNVLTGMKVAVGDDSENALNLAHIWVENAKQLEYLGKIARNDQNTADNNLLQSNFALKNDINANHISNFNGIGDVSVENGTLNEIPYTGTFDGRGYSIVGLDVTNPHDDLEVNSKYYDYGGRMGIFNTIGTTGVVKNLKVYHSEIEGGAVGAIAGINNGTIENVYTFGNKIESSGVVRIETGDDKYGFLGSAGGVAGINNGVIKDSDSNNIVIAGVILDEADNGYNSIPSGKYDYDADSLAGGVTGLNGGYIQYAVSDSAITASRDADSLGGIAGVSVGINGVTGRVFKIEAAESYGIVNGTYNGTSSGNEATADNVGGIVGTLMNGSGIEGAYNEAEIIGANMIGGIVGYSGRGTQWAGTGTNNIVNVINSGSINGIDYVGGLLGYSDYTELEGARNTGEITGQDYVAGIVGYNKSASNMSNIVNDNKASITGIRFVGGVAGKNEGTISANSMHLDNNGELYGKQYVGGIVGHNASGGQVVNTINDITLNVKTGDVYYKEKSENGTTKYLYSDTPKDGYTLMQTQYFGGVVGLNEGTITDATNRGSVNASGADYVGGIVGKNSGSLQGAGNSNDGNVTGSSFVGGVVGHNAVAVNGQVNSGSNQVEYTTVKNEGKVIAEIGGAGGIFGFNSGDITNMVMINEGEVYGKSGGTGGIIATNSGNISNSSLINTVGGVVVGEDTVGGLIGKNSGSITGGRDTEVDGGNYYKYHISNNGDIKAQVWSYDTNGEIIVNGAMGDNVGGLVGSNDAGGIITAAYNTGDVTGVENVGGIVGQNSANIDQVFSAEGATISGADKVGGLIGSNSGSLSNHYNKSTVAVGNETVTNAPIVGSNIGTGTVSANNYNDTTIWKSYDQGATNLLKVFLTKANFVKTNAFAYDAHNHKLVVKAVDNEVIVFVKDLTDNTAELVEIGKISTASSDPNAAHSLADYLRTMDANGTSNLIVTNSGNIRNAGTYDLGLSSEQININGVDSNRKTNHNNLGFDFGSTTVTIDKATIDLVLNSVTRVYGDAVITSNTSADAWIKDAQANNTQYGYSYSNNVNEEMQAELASGIVFTDLQDGALVGDNKTNNAGNHRWQVDAELIDDNYQFGVDNAVAVFEKTITSANYNSYVGKANLSVSLNGVQRTYGEADFTNGTGYDNITISGWTNGDGSDADKGNVTVAKVSDGAVDGVSGEGVETNNAGTYQWTGNISLAGDVDTNYNLVDANGNAVTGALSAASVVDRANLTIKLNDVSMTYGQAESELTYGHVVDANKKLVNGDDLSDVVTFGYNNTAYVDGSSTVTKDVSGSPYVLTKENLEVGSKYGNYVVDIVDGTVTMGKANLTVIANNSSVNYGDKPIYSGTVTGFVNGDTAQSLGYEQFNVTDLSLEGTSGTHANVIGLVVDSNVVVSDVTIGNYQLDVTPGTLTVADQFIIDDPMEEKHKIWYAEDRYAWYMWDKNRNERERKAEVYFVDGATKL